MEEHLGAHLAALTSRDLSGVTGDGGGGGAVVVIFMVIIMRCSSRHQRGQKQHTLCGGTRFSLGKFCAWPVCRLMLLGQGVWSGNVHWRG